MTDALIEAVARGIWNRPVGYKRVSFDQLDAEDQDVFRAYARAAIAAIDASKYMLVPVASTEAMYRAGLDVVASGSYDPDDIYTAMLAAAPKVVE